MLQIRMCQTEGQQGTVQAQSTVESSSLQVIVTHSSPCATPALSPQTPSGSATATTVRMACFGQNHQSLTALCDMFTVVLIIIAVNLSFDSVRNCIAFMQALFPINKIKSHTKK